jgi:hypothetical protein
LKIEQIVAWLESGSRKEKRSALQKTMVLSEKGSVDAAIPLLIKLTDGSDSELALDALGVLGFIVKKSEKELFLRHLTSVNPVMKSLAANILANRGHKSIAYSTLRTLINSSDPNERSAGNMRVDFVPPDFNVGSISATELREVQGTIPSEYRDAGQMTVGIITKVRERFSAKLFFAPGATEICPWQFQSIERVEKFGNSINRIIAKEMIRTHKKKHPSDTIPRGEVFVLSAAIPRCDQGKTPYFFLLGRADIERHRDFACLFRNSDEFCEFDPNKVESICKENDATVLDASF